MSEDAMLAEVRRLARRVRRRERSVDQARNDLNTAIRQAIDLGTSTRRLAEAARVSQPRIVQIGHLA
jgi:hypothetical protein